MKTQFFVPLFCGSLLFLPTAFAQEKPEGKVCKLDEKSIETLKKCGKVKIVVSGGYGGGTDAVSRVVSAVLSKAGVVAVVENQPGTNGYQAALSVKNEGNPCTFLVASNSNLSLNQLTKMYPSIDPIEEFEPVSLLTTAPFVLGARVDKDGVEIKSMADFQAAVKSNSLFYGSAGQGSFSHLLAAKIEMELISDGGKKELSLKPEAAALVDVHVPFKSSSELANGVNSDSVHYGLESPGTIYKLSKSAKGKFIILGNTGTKDITFVTRDEKGEVKDSKIIESISQNFPQLKNLVAYPYVGILGAKIPKDKRSPIGKVPSEFEKEWMAKLKAMEEAGKCAVSDRKMMSKFYDQGYNVENGSSKALVEVMSEYKEGQKWDKLIKDLKIVQRAQDDAFNAGFKAPAYKVKPKTETEK